MKEVTLLQPPRVIFGNGSVGRVAELFAQRGARRVLLVSSSPVLPQLGPLLADLQQAGCKVIQSRPVDSEPTLAMFETVLQQARSAEIDSVLGAGGGSALDVAKLAAALVRGRQEVSQVLGINRLERRELYLACVPTTSGTGSEVSPNAILLDVASGLKKGAVSPHLVPDAAILDPLLTLSVPPGVTAATGLDALTHCIEAYANLFAHPAVDLYALEGIRLISRNLFTAVRDGANVDARARLALGSYYGGLCLGPVNTAAVHALAYPLGGAFGIAHGISNAVLLPHVLRFNLPAATERYAEVAAALGVQRNGSALAAARAGVDRVIRLSRECGVPQSLAALGIPRDALPSLAKAAMQVTRLLKNNPRTLTEQDALGIYEAGYAND
jgi:alcohol dehydrogenase class IV